MIINVNEKRYSIHWRVFRRVAFCSTRLILHPIHIGWNEFLCSRLGSIVTLPFSVLLPNRTTGSISLLINFPKATCLVLCARLSEGDISNLGLAKTVDQFFGLSMCRRDGFDSTPPPSPFFLTHLRSCYQAVVSLAGLKAIRFGYLEYVVEGMSMKEKMENACFWNDYAFVYVHMRCLDFYFEFFLASFDHLFGWILSRKRKFIFFKFFYWVKKIG